MTQNMKMNLSTTKKEFQVCTVNKIWLPAFSNPYLCSQPSPEELEVLPTQHVEDRNKEKETLSLENNILQWDSLYTFMLHLKCFSKKNQYGEKVRYELTGPNCL
jgi:hypothetical protein